MEIEDSIILLCLVLSAFFSGMEIAFVSSNRIFIEIEKNKPTLTAKILQFITKNPSRFITTMLIGNNISLVVYGIFMGNKIVQVIFPTLEGVELPLEILFYQTLISTGIILLTAEFLPKVFFQLYANQLVRFFAPPAAFFHAVFTPVSLFVLKITNVMLRILFRSKTEELELSFSKIELGDYIEEQVEGVQNKAQLDSEIQIFQNALEFSTVKAREVMVPRAEITAIEKEKSIEELKALFASTGFSKIPVFDENIDDIIGFVHAFEMLKQPSSIKQILLPVEFVHEPNTVNDVLSRLTRKRKSIAVVLDEYGGTAGLLTIEDIVEELFGEIEDEHDRVDHYEKKLSPTHFEFSARLEIDYINETYFLELPKDENYETLGGLIVFYTEEIPKKGLVLRLDKYQIEVTQVSSTKIERISLSITNE
ncbi:hemolysin family protein [Flavobacteriaceae bacterium]|nr:hemolysin family protein [Flavobacteriaceae bacterium]MDA9887306.1 hemolysin family protein [Flavobacteriaceae bacterium]MDB4113172.1 hemolysin family protein [Flavobacteriaceae bacterium]MDB4186308.1 hemolysin family protein [Flavobacteriaceae bacterium]MDB9824274.1 hemolysin family protein [Flavobacteriaceae bacterium]